MASPTIKDVARVAGVSLKTVSRVINDESGVQGATRERVQSAVAKLGYQPNQLARGLRGARAMAIGLAYDNPNAHYVIALQEGVLSVCREAGYELLIHPCKANSPDLVEELCRFVRNTRLAGLVLAPPMSEHKELVEQLASQLAASGAQLMRIVSAASEPHESEPCIFVDDRDAAFAITEHLIQLGHMRIGFIWGGKQHFSSWERFRGYEDALRLSGMEPDPALIVEADYAFEEGFRAARRLLALPARPTAIFGSNDEIAAGVLAAAKSTGLEVPYDLSIAGFEDSPFSRQSWPALTTARQGTADIARAAATSLLRRIQERGANPPVSQGFTPELVIRGSTAPPRPRS